MEAAIATEQAFEPSSTQAWRPRHNPWAVAFTVTLATFMEILDTSIANVSLPHIAGGLSTGVDESTWVLTSYLVANAVVLPMSGWISGYIGRKRFYMTCVVLFTLSSLMCGFAPSLATLIFFRVMQGASGGGLQPSEQAILADTFAPEQFGMAFAIYGMAVVLAPAIGPTLGGYITDNFNWRWIFFINVPVGMLSVILTQRLVEDPPWIGEERRRAGASYSVDYIGFALVALGFGCLQVVLDKGQREDWFESNFIIMFSIVSALSLLGFALWESRHKNPIVDVHLFTNRSFATSTLMMFMVGVVLFGSTVLLPQYLQQLMRYTAQQAGEVLSPGGFVIMAMMPMVGVLVSRYDPRWLIAFGFATMGLAFTDMAFGLNLQIDFRTAVLYRIYQSIGLALLFVPINAIAYVGMAREKNNQISGIINLSRNIGASVGISMMTTIVARRTQAHQSRLVEHITPYGLGMGRLLAGPGSLIAPGAPTQQSYGILYGRIIEQAATKAFIDAVWAMAIVAFVMIPFAMMLRRVAPGSLRIGAH